MLSTSAIIISNKLNFHPNTFFLQFHPQNDFYWLIESYFTYLELKRPNSFWIKFWNSGHSVLWKHVKLPSRLAQTTKGWHDKNWTPNSALHYVLEWVRLWFFFLFCAFFWTSFSKIPRNVVADMNVLCLKFTL